MTGRPDYLGDYLTYVRRATRDAWRVYRDADKYQRANALARYQHARDCLRRRVGEPEKLRERIRETERQGLPMRVMVPRIALGRYRGRDERGGRGE